MDRLGDATHGYECVDPPEGEEIWRLDDPTLDPGRRRRLEAHLAVCDACRIQRDMERRVGSGLLAGRLSLRRRSRTGGGQRRATRRLVGSGGLFLAASLALLVLVPPRPRDAGRVERGGSRWGFLQPVEGEVLLTAHPRLRWTPVPGATAYRVTVSEVGGPCHWRGRTADPTWRLPPKASLPPGRDYRAIVVPVPADLAAAGGLSVSFRRGRAVEWCRYRWRAAPPWIPALGMGGLLLLAGGWLVQRRTAGAAG